MSENESFILSKAGLGFGEYGPEDELLHPEVNGQLTSDEVTETQFYSFNVPEENILGYGYFWHHPNLGTVTGGVQAWQGIKPHHLACEIYDMRAYQSDKHYENVNHFKMPCSYQVDVIEPFKEMRVCYEDSSRDNAFDITCTAIAPPAMLPNRKHFEQPMKTQGSVTLRGKTYKVDSYSMRDRSWGEARPDAPVDFPPSVWLTGIFNDNFSFNCMATDNPSQSPEWQGLYDISEDAVLKGGWIYLNGNYTRIVRSVKRTERDPVSFHPVRHKLEVEDENGLVFHLNGEVTVSAPSGLWTNGNILMALVRWECSGPGISNLVGWGDSQEVQWTDFVYAMHKQQQP